MTPIRDDTRENQLLRALYAIESLAEYSDSPGDVEMIYRIAHCVSGHCQRCMGSIGFDLVEQCEADAKAKDIYDVEKMLTKGSVTT